MSSKQTNINGEELRQLLADMTPRSEAFNIVKAEMLKRGRWKNLPRGYLKEELRRGR